VEEAGYTLAYYKPSFAHFIEKYPFSYCTTHLLKH
jgi:hypothetical protein